MTHIKLTENNKIDILELHNIQSIQVIICGSKKDVTNFRNLVKSLVGWITD